MSVIICSHFQNRLKFITRIMLRSLIACALAKNRLISLTRLSLSCPYIQYAYHRLNLPEASEEYQIDPQNIESFLVQLRKFNYDSREKAILFILSQIKKRKLPAEILFNEIFLDQARLDPHIFIETKLQMLEISVRTLQSRILSKQISREEAKEYISLLNKTQMECYPQYFSQISQEQGFIYMFAFNTLKRDMTVLFLKHFTEGQERYNNFSTWNYIYEKMVQQIIEDIQIRVHRYEDDAERAQRDELSQTERAAMEQLRHEILYFLDAGASWTLILDETYQQLYKITKNKKKYIEGMQIIKKYIKQFLIMYSNIGDISDFSIDLLKMKRKLAEIDYIQKKIDIGEEISPIQQEIVGEEFRITCEELCLQALDKINNILSHQETEDLLEKVEKFTQFVVDVRAEQWREIGGYDLHHKLAQIKAYIVEKAPENIRAQLSDNLENILKRTLQQTDNRDA